MSAKTQNERIVFGLKVKQLRQEQGLSFSDLSAASGMSVSYLNEIEKGKKYPKAEKITALAKALHIAPDELTSPDLKASLAPVGDLLQSNFLNELPLELFGIELSKVIEIIANAPKRVGAFISTLVELSRNYALREENFYFGALRSYLEMHNNYFEEIEQQVDAFLKKHPIDSQVASPANALALLLEKRFGYTIVDQGLDAYPELQDLRSVYQPKAKTLLLNSRLTEMQKAFQLGKELGFQYLGLKQRANTSSLLKVNSFEEVLSHFKAGYFSAAILIQREPFLEDLRHLFAQDQWDDSLLLGLAEKYMASPETVFQRMTNLIPQYLGIKKLFFVRFTHATESDRFLVDKELHLDGRHHPHSSGLFEHYCRRWLSLSLLKDLRSKQVQNPSTGNIAGIQRATYHGTKDEYLCLTLARPAYPSPDKNVSVTLGILIDGSLKKKIHFLNDPNIPNTEVSNTCERCPIQNCDVRAARPVIVDLKDKRWKVQNALDKIEEQDF
jgi:transcriptional regulator with XRE-family HTH domain